jgi:putative ABC transport system substrate-binding protein
MAIGIGRRQFISALGGTVVAWPLAAGAQPAERMRRVGVLVPFPQSDAEAQTRIRVFRQELQKLGWTEGTNVQFDERWTNDDMDRVRADAAAIVGLKPDVIVTTGGRVIPILKQMTQSVPIVMNTADPVGAGIVDSLARPGGNITGFSLYEFSIIGKSIEMLKKIAPNVVRVALIFNADNPTTKFFVRSFNSFAEPLAVQPIIAPVHGLDDIERTVGSLAEQANGAALFPPDLTITKLREQVVTVMARHHMPALYSDPAAVKSGGLISYSSDRIEIYRQTAFYVDRILRGEKPADLPVQEPTKYVLTINLSTAKALGLTVPPTLLALADEVIE